MATSDEIKKRALELSEKTDSNSISPKEVGGIMHDLASLGENAIRNGGTLGIRKVYTSIAEMEADKNPKDLWGNPLKKGNLVVIYDGTTTGTDNNKVYAYMNPGWQIATHLDAGYATRTELSELGSKVLCTKIFSTKGNTMVEDEFSGIIPEENHLLYIWNPRIELVDTSGQSYRLYVKTKVNGTYQEVLKVTTDKLLQSHYEFCLPEGSDGTIVVGCRGVEGGVLPISVIRRECFSFDAIAKKTYTPYLGDGTPSNSGNGMAVRAISAIPVEVGTRIDVSFIASVLGENEELHYGFTGTKDLKVTSNLGSYKSSDTLDYNVNRNNTSYTVKGADTKGILVCVAVYNNSTKEYRSIQPSYNFKKGDFIVSITPKEVIEKENRTEQLERELENIASNVGDIDYKIQTNIFGDMYMLDISSWNVGYYTISGGLNTQNNDWRYSDHIQLEKDCTIKIHTQGSGGVSILVRKDGDAIKPLLAPTPSDDVVYADYEYVAKEDMEVIVSVRVGDGGQPSCGLKKYGIADKVQDIESHVQDIESHVLCTKEYTTRGNTMVEDEFVGLIPEEKYLIYLWNPNIELVDTSGQSYRFIVKTNVNGVSQDVLKVPTSRPLQSYYEVILPKGSDGTIVVGCKGVEGEKFSVSVVRENNIGFNVTSKLSYTPYIGNGTPSNSGNLNAVRSISAIPVGVGTIIKASFIADVLGENEEFHYGFAGTKDLKVSSDLGSYKTSDLLDYDINKTNDTYVVKSNDTKGVLVCVAVYNKSTNGYRSIQPSYNFKKGDFVVSVTPKEVIENEDRTDQLEGKLENVGISSKVILRNFDIDNIVDAIAFPKYNKTTRFTFVHSSDTHADIDRHNNAIDYINSKDYIVGMFNTGDVVSSNFTDSYDWFVDSLSKTNKLITLTIGNHEVGNSKNVALCGNNEETYNRYISPLVEHNGLITNNKNYWYRDFEEYGIRVISIYEYDNDDLQDSNTYKIKRGLRVLSQEQIDWFIETLNAVPSNYGIIVLTHQNPTTWGSHLNYNEDWHSFSGINPQNITYSQILTKIINAWISGVSINESVEFIDDGSYLTPIKAEFDFSSRGTGEFIGWFFGHSHLDSIGTIKDFPNQNWFAVTCTSANANQSQFDDLPRVIGEKSEDAFNVVSIDRENRKIFIVRIGSNMNNLLQERKCISVDY